MQASTALPLETKQAPWKTREARSPSPQSSTSAGDSHHSEQYLAEEILMPSTLYPPTPTPTTLYEPEASFNSVMWSAPPVPERQKLRSSARTFIPMSCQPVAEPATLVKQPLAPVAPEVYVDPADKETLASEARESAVAVLAPEACEAKLEKTLPSLGSELHSSGECKPCAWFWKASGCASGEDCDYCHLCPAGELKKRKKAKVQAIRGGLPGINSYDVWSSTPAM